MPQITGRHFCSAILALLSAFAHAYDPPERIMVVRPTFEGQTDRQLRYEPQDGDFVIQNGPEFFNRPLYGGNTAFRVDAGDRPELSLYLPGQVGNVRFGIGDRGRFLWLHEAADITARYRPGSMIYEIRDSSLGDAVVRLSVTGLYDAEGLIIRINQSGGTKPIGFFIAYGGAGGKKGKRGGDIGCENEPVGRFFQLRAENCKGNQFTVDKNRFTLKSKPALMTGIFSDKVSLSVADAAKWDNLRQFVQSGGTATEFPVLLASLELPSDSPLYAAIKRPQGADQDFTAEELPSIYENAERTRKEIAERVRVDTPDPYIDAAASALCTAADAIWDETQGSVMHGAVAWRSKYLGWRGPYANDAFGWHERAKRHLTYWAGQQNTKPVPEGILPADPAANLSRNEPSLHSNGDMSGKHYDMNLVYIDTLIRHILWTGDLALAEQLWPVMERHIAWERRLFRRTFGPDQLPLYEAYAAIWASDDLQYHGGGVTHTSAYNYFHNLKLAELANALGKDSSAYRQEAELILKGMRQYLWLSDGGWYGEWKDLLGEQRVHPAAALWTFYHTIDSQAADPLEAWQMSRYVDTQIAHIPIHSGRIHKGDYYTLPTTNWMPYTWSTNNVVMAEAAHTALAYWQAGRADQAMALFKGSLLDSMYMGLCPGNAGMTTYFDMARGEAQRDFGDAVGICARALIEGLFGVSPDLLNGELIIRPGFPPDWDYAKIKHPDFSIDYQRDQKCRAYSIVSAFSKPLKIRLIVPAEYSKIDSVKVNGSDGQWKLLEGVGQPLIEIAAKPADRQDIVIQGDGDPIVPVDVPGIVSSDSVLKIDLPSMEPKTVLDPQQALKDIRCRQGSLEARVQDKAGHRTVFARLRQDQMEWIEPLMFEVRPPYEIAETAQSPDAIRFKVRNNTSTAVNEEFVIAARDHQTTRRLVVNAFSESEEIILGAGEFDLLPGSNSVMINCGTHLIEGTVTNWRISTGSRTVHWDTVDLSPLYNDTVTHIFRNTYLSPRSPYCSLAIPKQGIGSWCDYEKAFDVDDSGLRKAASLHQDRYIMPQGIVLSTPADASRSNVLFVSQWDNYPNEATIPLTGRALHAYFLVAGSTNSMQSRFDNGRIVITYADATTDHIMLHNPTTWWPIDQDYFIDDYGFKRPQAIPPRIHLKTGQTLVADPLEFKGKGGKVDGGAATLLDIPLDPAKDLQFVKVQAIANEVIIGIMSVTLVR